MQTVAIAQLEEGNELIMSLEVLGEEPMKLRKTTLAQQMAKKAYDATKVNTEESVPTVFKQHWRTFSEQEARQLPPHREFDHQIELHPDAPCCNHDSKDLFLFSYYGCDPSAYLVSPTLSRLLVGSADCASRTSYAVFHRHRFIRLTYLVPRSTLIVCTIAP